MGEKAVDILCFYEDRRDNGKPQIKCREYVVRASRAEERLRELLEKVIKGEIESFLVSISDAALPDADEPPV